MRLRTFVIIMLAGGICLPCISIAQEKEEKEETKSDFPLENFYVKVKKRPQSILRNVRFGFSTGYGNTFFSHELPGFGVYQPTGGAPSIFDTDLVATRYSNWVNQSVVDGTATGPGFMASSDTAKLGFKGNSFNLPLRLTIHYEFKGKYRIGGGYTYELMNIGQLSPISYADNISSFQPSNASGWMSKYFGTLGFSFYRLGDYLFTGELEIGGFNPGANFDGSLVAPGIYVNGGVTIERELSEYLRLFARPSFEFKGYTFTLPEGGKSIDHNINAFYINIGISYSIPDLPKCFIADCKSQKNHTHGNKEYRSRVHPIYKWQNPNYGQNHPNLIKYKGRNKKKLNPY